MITATQAAQKLATGIRNGGTAYEMGVNAVTTNPAQKAIAKRDKWIAAMQDPATHDRWSRGLGRVTLPEWQQATLTVGKQRFTQSADKAASNYQDFADNFFPVLERNVQQVNAMPDTTLDERIARATQMMRLNAQYNRP